MAVDVTKPLVAIVLAAGVGKRLGPASLTRPKALLRIGSETLLARLVRQLHAIGVPEVVIVVGYGADQIHDALGTVNGVRLIENPDFQRGAILSLWSAREFLDRPSLVMDADVYVPNEMIARLVRSPHENCFLLDGRVEPTGEEQMLMVRGARIVDIARDERGEFDLTGESVGFLKLSAQGARTLRELLGEHVARGDIDIEHEEVYPELLERVRVGFETVDDLDWTEIDFPEDVRLAIELAERQRGN